MVEKGKLAHPLANFEKRIQAIRLLPEIERSFIPYPASSSQHSSSNMSDANKVSILLDLEELDNYPTPVQVKKETPAVTSSKLAATPKPNPRTRASMAKKRKGSKTTAPTSEGFPMRSSGLQHLLHLYTDACGTVKLQVASIKKLETTVADQRTIVEAKTRHYEDKLKKVTQDAEVKLAASHVEHEHAMISFREGIKNSAVVSLLQARIMIAYEAKETGLECPTWPFYSWVAKRKEHGGNPVPYPAKAGARETSKAAEVVDDAGEKKDAGGDAGEDADAEEVKNDGGDAAVRGHSSGQ
ncbi:hypothetical protein Hanom_Chr09g00803231 [Helianthus anomalus]